MKGNVRLFRVLAPVLALGLVGLLFWKADVKVLDVCASAVVFSAKTLLPLSLTLPAPQESVPVTEQATTAPASAEEATTTTSPAATAASTDTEDAFFATPQDVLDRMKLARQSAKGDKRGGALLEKQYTDEGVTDKKGVVRVKNTNDADVDLTALLRQKADLTVTRDAPCVLLDRSFYAASFASRSNDKGQNMVRIGDEICNQLEEAGLSVLHDTEIHDARYTGAYENSRAAVKAYLEKYPSIQITLDVHRDAILPDKTTKIKPTAVIGGKKAAQVMIISGCQEEGNGVTDFPDWEQNLVFALQLQKHMEVLFPGLTRPLFFCARRYNMHLTHCSLLLEVGSDGNTLEEAVISGRCIGKALAALMKKYEKH